MIANSHRVCEQWLALSNDVDVTFTETCIDLIYTLSVYSVIH